MIKILVISDTHGNLQDLDKLSQIISESDYVFHLGDHYDDMRYFYPKIKDKLYRVHGNCDWGAEKELIVEIEGHRILATHGDLYGAKLGTDRLVYKAMQENCDIVFYGHTHCAEITKENGIYLINPGTLQKYSTHKTFAYVVISGDKVIPAINENYFLGK